MVPAGGQNCHEGSSIILPLSEASLKTWVLISLNTWSIVMYCVSGNFCHRKKLETVGEAITHFGSWLGLEQMCLEGQGPSPGTPLSMYIVLPVLLASWGGAGDEE